MSDVENNFFNSAFSAANAPKPAADLATTLAAVIPKPAPKKPAASWTSNTVFFGNFPANGDTKVFKALLSRTYGPVAAVRVRSVELAEGAEISGAKKSRLLSQKAHSKLSKLDGVVAEAGGANAYVRFENEEGFERCIAEAPGRVVFGGRRLAVDRASTGRDYTDFDKETGAPTDEARAKSSSQYNTKRSVYFGNMPYTFTENDIWEYFETLVGATAAEDEDENALPEKFSGILPERSAVLRVRLIRDRITRQSRGRGFVEFAERKGAQAAVKAGNEAEVGDRKISVSRVKEGAVPKSKVAAVTKQRRAAHQKAVGNRRGAAAHAGPTRGAAARRGAAKAQAQRSSDAKARSKMTRAKTAARKTAAARGSK